MATNPKDVTQNTVPPSEKSKSPSPSKGSPQSNEAENAAPSGSRVYVEWILPTLADNKTKDERDATTQFAPLFSNRRWSLTDTPPLTVRGPPLRSPACTNKGLRKKLTGGVNKGSTCLMRLFNRISEDIHAPADTSNYSRAAFDGAFRDDFAVVASESSANPIVTLDRDLDVNVTLRHEDKEHENATIRFIRRPPPGSASDQHEYFITAPSQLRLTVNGQTYIAEEGQSLVVGPLRGLSIVELLSQPIFFYRNAEDLNISKATGVRASALEMKSRDKNGDIDGEQVDVTWTPIEARGSPTPPSSPSNSSPGSLSNPADDSVQQATSLVAQEAAEKEAAEKAATEKAAAEKAATEKAAAEKAAAEKAAAEKAAEEKAAAEKIAAETAAAERAAEEAAKRAANEAVQKAAKNGQADLKGKQKETSKRSHDELKPCEAMRRRLDELMGKPEVNSALRALKRSTEVTNDPGTWLGAGDTATAIASVLLAITRMQNENEGFSFTTEEALDYAQWAHPQREVPRPGRPFFFPIIHGTHIVLALIQLDGDMPTFSIFDSKFAFYGPVRRQEVFNIVMRVFRDSMWWRTIHPSWDAVPKPTTAHWIPCAQQSDDVACGYHTIVFAWALALGLELNPHAAPIWDKTETGNENLFQTILDIAHLARLGFVDWELIYNFLRCYRFVLEGTVPANRRFSSSVLMRGPSDLRNGVGDTLDDEFGSSVTLADIRGRNFIRLPTGWPHTSNEFPRSFGQRTETISEYGHFPFGTPQDKIDGLVGYFDKNNKVSRTKTIGKKVGDAQADYFLRSLKRTEGKVQYTSHERIYIWYRELLANKRSHARDTEWLGAHPCALSGEGLGRMSTISRVTKNLANALPGMLIGRSLDLGEVNIAIAAVVEAIDQHQVNLNRGNQNAFTGGFALATSTAIGYGRVMPMDGMSVSRPRRCFMLPLTITGREIRDITGRMTGENPDGGHHILAVVQEEERTPSAWNPDKSHFVVRLLDSAPWTLKDDVGKSGMRDHIHTVVQDTATNLEWTRQRNDSETARFRRQPDMVQVFSQQRGRGWQCGMHTILYAWILALGLTPSAEAVNLDELFYIELEVLIHGAVAGLLDWQTLVAWLFCRGVTTSRDLRSVPENRRFALSVYQTADRDARGDFMEEKDLSTRLRQVFETERRTVATMTTDELPYDFSNNVTFPYDTPGKASEGTAGGSSQGPSGAASGGPPGATPRNPAVDALGYEPGTAEYETLEQCTAEQLDQFRNSSADVRALLLDQYQLAFTLQASNDEQLSRTIEDCGVPQPRTLKRKAGSHSEWTHNGGDSLASCKRFRVI